MSKIALLGTGLIGGFYAMSLVNQRKKDVIVIVCSGHENTAREFAKKFNIPKFTTNIKEAIDDPEVEVVVVGLPNHLHREAVDYCCKAKKHVLCTKPLATKWERGKGDARCG